MAANASAHAKATAAKTENQERAGADFLISFPPKAEVRRQKRAVEVSYLYHVLGPLVHPFGFNGFGRALRYRVALQSPSYLPAGGLHVAGRGKPSLAQAKAAPLQRASGETENGVDEKQLLLEIPSAA